MSNDDKATPRKQTPRKHVEGVTSVSVGFLEHILDHMNSTHKLYVTDNKHFEDDNYHWTLDNEMFINELSGVIKRYYKGID